MNFIIFLVVFFPILHLDGGYCWIPHLELHKIKLAIYMQALLTLSCTLPSAFSSLSLSLSHRRPWRIPSLVHTTSPTSPRSSQYHTYISSAFHDLHAYLTKYLSDKWGMRELTRGCPPIANYFCAESHAKSCAELWRLFELAPPPPFQV